MNNVYKFEELTAIELEKLKQEHKILLFYLGSIEQHGEHLPVGTDILCIKQRVEKIAQLSNNIIFCPTQLGYSYNHFGMNGTISLSSTTYLNLLKETLEQLCIQGWKRFMFFSGHNGNWPIIEIVIHDIKLKFPYSEIVIARNHPCISIENKINRFYKNFDYHAGLIETAIIEFYFPNLVDKDKIPSGNKKLPKKIKKIMELNNFDEINMLLIDSIMPQHSRNISDNGSWGINNSSFYTDVPVKNAMKNFITFYIELIRRWDNLNEV